MKNEIKIYQQTKAVLLIKPAGFLNRYRIAISAMALLCILALSSCKKLIEVDSPVTSVNGGNVYQDNATATGVMTGMLTRMSNRFSSFDITSMAIYPELSADNLSMFDPTNQTYYLYYANDLTSNTTSSFWTSLYFHVYAANAAIDGLNSSTTLTPAVKQRCLGEAYFIRALSYFYLTNLYGDVPLVLSTDYNKTFNLPRSGAGEIYDLIVSDLNQAKTMLDDRFVDATLLNTTTERTRPNLNAARALLARVYLYRGKWAEAEAEASSVIAQTTKYSLTALNAVFLKNSNETIWSLQPVNSATINTSEGNIFIPPAGGLGTAAPLIAAPGLVSNFETGDQRKSSWLGSLVQGGVTYYYPFKYKVKTASTQTEYTMVLRLAEQYLIRAEARAEQNNITGAQSDLNAVRTRAGLGNTPAATQAALRDAVIRERRSELFTEGGHRWLDLKRTGRLDAVMTAVVPSKPLAWQSNKSLYPIPLSDMLTDPNLKQNPGY